MQANSPNMLVQGLKPPACTTKIYGVLLLFAGSSACSRCWSLLRVRFEPCSCACTKTLGPTLPIITLGPYVFLLRVSVLAFVAHAWPSGVVVSTAS